MQQQMMIAPTFSKLVQKFVGVARSYQVITKSLEEAFEHIKDLTDDKLLRMDEVSIKDVKNSEP